MKTVGLLMMAAGLSAVGYWTTGLQDQRPVVDLARQQVDAAVMAFKVLRTGRDQGCRLVVQDADAGERARVIVARECADDLRDVRYWAGLADGSVALTAQDGRHLMRLGEADGAAYESFGTGAPVTLISLD